MGRILAIDYGEKRSGIAVTDVLQIIASPLMGMETKNLLEFLKKYVIEEEVSALVIGMPSDQHGRELKIAKKIEVFADQMKLVFPNIPITFVEESYSSKEAQILMIESRRKKKFRQQKENLDMFSALVILRRHLGIE